MTETTYRIIPLPLAAPSKDRGTAEEREARVLAHQQRVDAEMPKAERPAPANLSDKRRVHAVKKQIRERKAALERAQAIAARRDSSDA